MQSGVHRQSSIRGKLKSSICCFRGTVHHDQLHHGELCYNKLNIPTTPRSQSTSISPPGIPSWLKKSSPPNSECGGDTPRIRGRSLKARMGRALHHHHHHHHHHRRQSHSADFSYDPSSYALNFENESPEDHPLRNFSSRLPASPPSSSTALKYSDDLAVSGVPPKEIIGYS